MHNYSPNFLIIIKIGKINWLLFKTFKYQALDISFFIGQKRIFVQ